MREPAKDIVRLQHILEAIERIKRYSNGKSFTEFIDNDMMYYAVVKNIVKVPRRVDHPAVKCKKSGR